jgi:nucleoside-diphosphate-sugar epimerase
LVTGGSGFFGQNLINELSKSKHLQITCVSRNPQKNFQNVNWVRGDLNNNDLISNLSKQKFKKLYHLAWDGLPDRSIEFSELNLNNSKRLIENLVSKNDIELNVIGSCLEYGDIHGLVLDESIPNGKNSFSVAKIKLNQYISELGVPYRWYRPFFVYGLGQHREGLIPTLLRNLKNNQPLSIKSICNSHDFVAISDVVKAIILSSNLNSIMGEINIGTGVLTTVGDIVSAFYKQFNLRFEMKFDRNPGLVSNSYKLRKIAGWEPEFTGLNGIMNYFNKLGEFK